jgi:type II restriction/modification system DNA methylase subunit YeeA
MQIRKTYREVNPQLLYHEVRDFILKQGAIVSDAKLETYSSPKDSSTFISRGTLTFKMQDKSGKAGSECLSVHIIGSARDETKLMLDIDDKLFTRQKLSALQDDLDFIFGSYEVKPD